MGLKLVWTKNPDFFLLEDRKRIEFREEAGDNLHLQQFLKEVEVVFSGGYGDRHTMLKVQSLSKNRNTDVLQPEKIEKCVNTSFHNARTV